MVPVACVSLAEVDVVWATQSEGEGAGFGGALGISTLSDGSSIVTGSFTETDTFGVTTLESAGGRDIFVAKIDASGNWVWAARAGSNTSIATAESDLIDETGTHVSTLSDGSSIVTGFFTGNATFGAATLESPGNYDVFVAKLDASGNWVWATSGGGTSQDRGYAISTLTDGSAIVSGNFQGTATFGTTTLDATGVMDDANLFVAKIDASGNWVWAKTVRGDASGTGVSTLSDGSAIVSGAFLGTTTFGVTTLESGEGAKVFVAKFSSNPSDPPVPVTTLTTFALLLLSMLLGLFGYRRLAH